MCLANGIGCYLGSVSQSTVSITFMNSSGNSDKNTCHRDQDRYSVHSLDNGTQRRGLVSQGWGAMVGQILND